MKIKQLDDILANKIAAGEVIERPANVVKELVENSIDASSSKIDIIIEEGGMNLIQIIDDGSGMDKEDARLAREAAAKAEAERRREEEEARKRGEEIKPTETVAEPDIAYIRTTRNISIRTVTKTSSWRIESAADVDKYLNSLRENLMKEISDDTILNVEL